MASGLTKKPCAKCDKGAGVTTCDGCQQSFCIKHIIEHRQELAVRLDSIGQEHDLLRRDLAQENVNHSLLIRINEWEQQSITKIQVVAEAARLDLQQSLQQTRNELKLSADQITHEIQIGRQMDDYTETDLTKWIQQLDEFRTLLQTPLTFDITEDDNPLTSINLIRVQGKQLLHSANMSLDENLNPNNIREIEKLELISERFSDFLGKVLLSDDGLLATCTGSYWDGSSVFGIRRYSSGSHEVRFRIENKGLNNIIFGITTTVYRMPVQTLASPYVYSWWDFDQTLNSVSGHRIHNDRATRTGDEITMTLDCDNRQIHFQHHRINMTAHLDVNLDKCPFPWRMLVTLRSARDSVRILV